MNDPLDQKLSAHFQARKTAPLPGDDFSARVLAALPPAKPAVAPRPVGWLAGLLAWDNILIAAGLGLAVAWGAPAGLRGIPGLDAIESAFVSLQNWPALSSVALVVGLTMATAYLFNGDDEEDETI
ncbi:MAG: hypothetical protein JSS11_13830 [Verrucomicrobia bacterium]|nr:hypothetical protein [Verrucomicrobiota bacterium]